MKKISIIVAAMAVSSGVFAAGEELNAAFQTMMDTSFKTTGIADKNRMKQLDFQKECSAEKAPSKKVIDSIEATQLKTIHYPADGKYFGDWKAGEKTAISGKGLTWSDKTPHDNGGGCYNCHQLSHKEIAYGTIGPSLQNYGTTRGNSDDVVKYTWGKIYNAKAFNACSNMPRNGDAEILTEKQMKDVMAFLFDPESPVNKK